MNAPAIAAFRIPQLVRVCWTEKRSKRRKSIAAVRLARSDEEAFRIAQRLEYCMVPDTAVRLVYQVSVISDRRPTGRDALADNTEWFTVWKGA